MSTISLASTVSELPWVLREQVLGYAESVNQALPEIFRDAGVVRTPALASQVVFLAGVRKLHSLVASSYWALDNSATLLRDSDVLRIRVGAQNLSRGGQVHSALRDALEALETALARQGVKEVVDLPYVELLQYLARDGSQ